MKDLRKKALELENEASVIKSLIVKIGGEFRIKKPDHEFTKDFNRIEAGFYEMHELLLKLTAENHVLKNRISLLSNLEQPSEDLNEEQQNSYIEESEQVNVTLPEPMSDIEYEQTNRRLSMGRPPF